MKYAIPLSLLLVVAASWHPLSAFSPYELYLMSGQDTHVGLIAELKSGATDRFTAAIAKCSSAPLNRQLTMSGIKNVGAFTRIIDDKHFAVIYFKYAGGQEYLSAARVFEETTSELDWSRWITPHPRAERYGRQWLQMEWINFIRGVNVDRAPTKTLMIGTTVIPEKELQYRTLHQTTWPGVVDQAVRGNIRNLNIFLVELDDLLVEFLYLEYVGQDEVKDDAANKADPINQRWWKLTDPCQKAFLDVKDGKWVELERVK